MDDSTEIINVTNAGGVIVVNFAVESLNDTNAEQLEKELFGLVDGPRNILINFSEVQYLSSAPVGKLMAVRKKAEYLKASVKLCCFQSRIREVCKLALLDKLFEVFDNEQDALNSFG